jgi:hypothetical protein
LAYTEDIIVGENTDTEKKNTKAVLGVSKEVGLELFQRKVSNLWVNIMLSEGGTKA